MKPILSLAMSVVYDASKAGAMMSDLRRKGTVTRNGSGSRVESGKEGSVDDRSFLSVVLVSPELPHTAVVQASLERACSRYAVEPHFVSFDQVGFIRIILHGVILIEAIMYLFHHLQFHVHDRLID